jgi:septal ring factor EnvC (AmiA/AmiB activator)
MTDPNRKYACVALISAMVLSLSGLLLIANVAQADSAPQGSLRDLERRARHAQALAEHVATLQKQLQETQAALQDALKTIEHNENRMADNEQKIASQSETIESQKRQIQNRDVMLRLFRSGEFEYYQVAEGDTLAAIAANPMVYGDRNRAVWLAYANALEENATLTAGTVLIIPRFAEGVQYDF